MSDDLPDARIGDWRFLPRQHELQRDGERRRLPRRLALILAELARTPGIAVERGTLLAAAWQRRGVDEEALSRAIAELRQALGDDAREPRYIQTIPKGGYRLIAAVAFEPDVTPTKHSGFVPPDQAGSHGAPYASDVPAPTALLARVRNRPIWPILMAMPLLLVAGVGIWWRGDHGSIAQPDTSWTAARLAREHPFLSAAGSERDPRFSPDGRWLAFVRREPGATGAQVWVTQRDGTAARVLTTEPGQYAAPAFVPGSGDITYERRSDGRCEIWRQPLFSDDPPQRLADCAARADASGLDWSRDGRHLLLVVPGVSENATAIAVLDAGAAKPRLLTAAASADGPDALPRFSPDGRHVVFVRGSAGERRLLQLDLTDANAAPRVLIADRNRIDGLAFTPGGEQLVLATDRHDYRALIAFDPHSGAVQRLGGRGAEGLDIATDGTLLYVQKLYIANLWTAELPVSAATTQRLTQGTRYVSQPALAPDGRHVAYVSTGEGRETVWLRDLDDASERRLPLDPSLRWVRPAFAPDGTALWLTGYGDDGAHAWQHELASGHTTRLDGAAADAVALRAGDDAHRVMARPQGTHFALFRLHGDTAQAIAGAEAVDEFQLTAHWLAFVSGEGALQLLDLDHAQAAARTITQIAGDNRYAWHLRDDALYFVGVENDVPMLQRLALLDASVSSLGSLAPNTAGPSLQVSRDGRLAIFGRVERVDVDLMMAEP
jgi:Tol biopolymer transport system component/DNA-binding winged helix-turn-helix (wHTH) protein